MLKNFQQKQSKLALIKSLIRIKAKLLITICPDKLS